MNFHKDYSPYDEESPEDLVMTNDELIKGLNFLGDAIHESHPHLAAIAYGGADRISIYHQILWNQSQVLSQYSQTNINN